MLLYYNNPKFFIFCQCLVISTIKPVILVHTVSGWIDSSKYFSDFRTLVYSMNTVLWVWLSTITPNFSYFVHHLSFIETEIYTCSQSTNTIINVHTSVKLQILHTVLVKYYEMTLYYNYWKLSIHLSMSSYQFLHHQI